MRINILSDDVKKYEELIMPALDNIPRVFLYKRELLFNFKWPKEIWVANTDFCNSRTKGLSRIDGEISVLSDMIKNNDIQGLKDLKSSSTERGAWGAYLPDEDTILLNPDEIWQLAIECNQFLNHSTVEEI